MPREHIGKRLRALRERAGLTQKAFADKLGVPWRSLQDWEYDRAAVDLYKASALLAAAEKITTEAKGRKATARRRRGRRT